MIAARIGAIFLMLGMLGCKASNSLPSEAISPEQDRLDNLATAYYPFQQCTNAYIEADDFNRESLFSGIVEFGLLEKVRLEAARFVPTSNPYIGEASEPNLNDKTLARLLISGLITHGASWSEGVSTEEKILRLRTLIAARLIMAEAGKMDCEPSKTLNYWIDQVDHENR